MSSGALNKLKKKILLISENEKGNSGGSRPTSPGNIQRPQYYFESLSKKSSQPGLHQHPSRAEGITLNKNRSLYFEPQRKQEISRSALLTVGDSSADKKAPINIFSFQTYNILKNGGAEELFKRKRKSLGLKPRASSSYMSRSSNKDSRGGSRENIRRNSPHQMSRPEFALTHSGTASTLVNPFKSQKNIGLYAGHSGSQPGHSGMHRKDSSHIPGYLGTQHPAGTVNPSFALTGSFMTRPRDKSSYTASKIEKEISEISSTIKAIHRELISLKERGTKITIEEGRSVGTPTVTLTWNAGGQIGKSHGSTHQARKHKPSFEMENATKPMMETKSHSVFCQPEPPFAVQERKPSLQMSKSVAKFSAMYEGPQTQKPIQLRPKHIQSRDLSLEVDQINLPEPDQSKLQDGEGLVRRLIGELSEHQQSKPAHQKSSLTHFVQGLSLKHSPSTHQHSKDTPHSQTLSGINNVLKSLFETTSVAFQQSGVANPPRVAGKATETDKIPPKQISFGNINLTKTVEEMIKKVVIQSKAVKYTPNNIQEYFNILQTAALQEVQALADAQKQALFIASYNMLQKQLLVEVTLEMIKDAGVNIQHLFQTTFARLGLDYEKYVQYENHRDQDLSARSIYDGDLDCTLEDPATESETERAFHKHNKQRPGFALDFQALYTSQEQPPQ